MQEMRVGVSRLRVVGSAGAGLCAMNVRSERMLVFAVLAATTQLGRLCKKTVRGFWRGVQVGSLSKKLRLN